MQEISTMGGVCSKFTTKNKYKRPDIRNCQKHWEKVDGKKWRRFAEIWAVHTRGNQNPIETETKWTWFIIHLQEY